jgi:diacylglycerol kinase family enzyme
MPDPASTRRTTAAGTLLLSALFAVSVTALVLSSPLYLLVSWLGLLVLVVGAARAVRFRDARRFVGVLMAIAGLLVAVVSIVAAGAGWSPYWVAALLVSGIGAGFTARMALRREHLAAPRLQANRPVLIANPWSGGGKVERFNLVEEARALGIETRVMQEGDDLEALARGAIEAGADVIGMAGGDGSQALVSSIAADAGIPFVCIPAGTRNHFARDLGLNRDDVVGALRGFQGEARRIDLAEVNGRTFVNNVSLGLYAETVSNPAYRDAKAETMIATLEKLEESAKRFDLRFKGPDDLDVESVDLLLVSNNPYELLGLPNDIGKRERMDGGKLGIVTLTMRTDADFAGLLTAYLGGFVDRFPGWSRWTAKSFTVDSAAVVHTGIDGEAIDLTPPLEFKIRPGALVLGVPEGTPSGPELGFVARPRLLTDLWAIAMGRDPSDRA